MAAGAQARCLSGQAVPRRGESCRCSEDTLPPEEEPRAPCPWAMALLY